MLIAVMKGGTVRNSRLAFQDAPDGDSSEMACHESINQTSNINQCDLILASRLERSLGATDITTISVKRTDALISFRPGPFPETSSPPPPPSSCTHKQKSHSYSLSSTEFDLDPALLAVLRSC